MLVVSCLPNSTHGHLVRQVSMEQGNFSKILSSPDLGGGTWAVIWTWVWFKNVYRCFLHQSGPRTHLLVDYKFLRKDAVVCEKANMSAVERNLPDRQTSLQPFLSPICKENLMEKEFCKTSRRNSGEIESIGGILIPISGNPEISVFLFQKTGFQETHVVTCNYWSPKGQHGAVLKAWD